MKLTSAILLNLVAALLVYLVVVGTGYASCIDDDGPLPLLVLPPLPSSSLRRPLLLLHHHQLCLPSSCISQDASAGYGLE